MHYACMSKSVTIRALPDHVVAELASRAALQGRSLQEYLHKELTELAEKPDIAQWLRTVREHKAVGGVAVDVEQLLTWRDDDRR